MRNDQTETTNTNSQKLYSERAITIATFFGGPIAAGILIRRNFINLGNELYGKHTIAIAVVSMVLIIAVALSLPDSVFDKPIGNLFPIVYTAIIAAVLHKHQGEQLKAHKENNGEFYSGWKAAGVGLISLIAMLAGIFGFILLDEPNFDTELYDQKVVEFTLNEEEALQLFTLLENEEEEKALNFIYDTGILLWQKNLSILEEMDNIPDIDQEFIDQNEVLREYCNLRIESYQLIGKSITDGVPDPELDIINALIDKNFEKL